ncbi:P450 reductase [Seminavis robusta]|uniref:NADPH--hemoprotein reductase n=1 Tax=Seminavis robusta TaxID=568900 RepID=A0A9N8HI44_9STRA|nr:P450 reductase [Seminavis robusta]|eukprot:Sro755_g197670.1 P450 reductase (666) ;mRNA; r:42920-44917
MLERTLKRRFPLCLSWQWLQLLLLCLCPSVTVLGQQCFDTGDCLDPAVLEDSHDAVTESTTSSSDSSSSIPDVLVLLCTQSFTGEQLVDEFLVDALAGQNNVRIQLVDEAGIDWAWKSDDQHHLLDETDQSTTQLLLSHRAKSILFVASTYGDGDPPNHALEFADWLLSSATSTTTSSEEEDPIPFAVFGLGDHAYQHFCIFAKLIDETLAQRGGRRLLPLQTADAQQGDQAGHFAQWTQQIVQVLQDQQILAPAQASSKQTQSQQQWTVPFASTGMDWRKSNRDPTYTNLATFHSATELLVDDSNNSNRSVLHVEFHIPKSTCQPLHVCQQLQPGDHLGIYPRNSRHTVQTALQWLLLDDHNNCQTTLAIRDNDNNKWIPHPINAYDFLAAHVDLAGRATPSALRALLPFVGTLELRALARDLTHVSTTATTSNDTTNTTTTTNTTLTLFDQWLAAQQNPFMTKLELAMVFECRPSLQALARALGPIQPRLYSIATVNQHDDSTLRIGICMAVAERGLATNFIAHMAPSALVAVLLRQSKFHYGSTSDHVNSSTLLVAAGTGIGPYIGFLQQQQQQQQQQHPSNAPIRLVYGARYPSDVLYRNELEQLLLARPAGLLLPLEAHVVFSRVPPRQHVQDVLLQPNMTAVLWKDVFVEAGRVFACGD